MTHSQTLELIWKSHSFWKEKHKEACDAMDTVFLLVVMTSLILMFVKGIIIISDPPGNLIKLRG